MPISTELLRVLKPTGSFVLNIKEPAVNGERSTYIIELILEMKKRLSYDIYASMPIRKSNIEYEQFLKVCDQLSI